MNAESRKEKIYVFLEKNPLSSKRKIADRCFPKTNFQHVNNYIKDLLEENRIGLIKIRIEKKPPKKQKSDSLIKIIPKSKISFRESYFAIPVFPDERKLIKKILMSDVIHEKRFSLIESKRYKLYKERYDEIWGLSEIIYNLIALLNLKVKILLMQKKSKNFNRKKRIEFKKKYFRKQAKYWSTCYYYEDEPTGTADLLEMYMDFISLDQELYKKQFQFLHSGATPLSERIKLMNILSKDGDYWYIKKQKRYKSNKTAKRILREITMTHDNRVFDWMKAEALLERETGLPSTDYEKSILRALIKNRASDLELRNYLIAHDMTDLDIKELRRGKSIPS